MDMKGSDSVNAADTAGRIHSSASAMEGASMRGNRTLFILCILLTVNAAWAVLGLVCHVLVGTGIARP